MEQWNLLGEWVAGIHIIILIVYSIKCTMINTNSEKLFRIGAYAVLLSIITNLMSSYVLILHEVMPVQIIEFTNSLYYLVLPLPAMVCFYYIASLVYNNDNSKQGKKRWMALGLPYVIYIGMVFLNYAFHNIFIITAEGKYYGQELCRIPYVICFYYIICNVYMILKNKKNITNKTIQVVYKISALAIFLLCIQILIPSIILSGTTGSATILVLYLYLKDTHSTTDQLTKILNREMLLFVLKNEIAKEEPFSLTVFSIRNFKGVNERFGFDYGDDLLVAISDYLTNILPADAVYRYSGDEFAVVITEESDIKEELLKEIYEHLQEFRLIEGENGFVTLISARVDYPQFGTDVRSLISAVDYSVAKLKEKKGGLLSLYDIHVCDEMRRKNDIIDRLNHAMRSDGIEVYYQPIFFVEANNFVQAEALMRLKENTINPIYPDEFIPIAEETGLIINLTYIILEKVCADLRNIIDTKDEKIPITAFSVNFPYVQFLQPDILERTLEILNKYQISPEQIKIEITERTLVEDTYTVNEVMRKMQKSGFIFELDDFGIDYSNISLFLTLPIDVIKIDRSLVLTSVVCEKNKVFFENLIMGIKALGTTIIAEGIEDKNTKEYVTNCGCDGIQGYIFSKPLPFKEFIEYIVDNQT